MRLKPVFVQVFVSLCERPRATERERERERETDGHLPESMEEITSKVKSLVTSSGSVQFSEGHRIRVSNSPVKGNCKVIVKKKITLSILLFFFLLLFSFSSFAKAVQI
jgi:hypothetical protein